MKHIRQFEFFYALKGYEEHISKASGNVVKFKKKKFIIYFRAFLAKIDTFRFIAISNNLIILLTIFLHMTSSNVSYHLRYQHTSSIYFTIVLQFTYNCS